MLKDPPIESGPWTPWHSHPGTYCDQVIILRDISKQRPEQNERLYYATVGFENRLKDPDKGQGRGEPGREGPHHGRGHEADSRRHPVRIQYHKADYTWHLGVVSCAGSRRRRAQQD